MAIAIGGYFAQLVLKSDQASFDKAGKDLKSVEDQTKKTGLTFSGFVGDVIKGFTLIGGAAVGAAYAVSNIQGKMATMAKTSGLGYTEMDKWTKALKTVGVDSSTIAGSMGNLQSAFSDYLKGFNTDAFKGVIKDLALLGGIDPMKFGKMGGTEQAQALAEQYQKNPNRQTLDLIDKIMPGMASILVELNKNKDAGEGPQTLNALLAVGATKQNQSKGDLLNGIKNERAIQGLETSLGAIWELVGNSIATKLRPGVKIFTDFIDVNGPKIKVFFDGIVDGFSVLFGSIGKLFAALDSMIGSKSMLGGLWKSVGEGADIGKHWDTTKGFDTPEKRALAQYAAKISGKDATDSFWMDQSSGAYKTASQFQSVTGGWMPQSMYKFLGDQETKRGLSGNDALSYEYGMAQQVAGANTLKAGTHVYISQDKTGKWSYSKTPVAGSYEYISGSSATQ